MKTGQFILLLILAISQVSTDPIDDLKDFVLNLNWRKPNKERRTEWEILQCPAISSRSPFNPQFDKIFTIPLIKEDSVEANIHWGLLGNKSKFFLTQVQLIHGLLSQLQEDSGLNYRFSSFKECYLLHPKR